MKHYPHFIGNSWVESDAGAWLEAINPANGDAWATISRGSNADVDAAVQAAWRAGTDGPWAHSTPRMRADALLGIAATLKARWEELVIPEIRDNGKRLAEVRGQLSRLFHWYQHCADAALKITPRALANATPGVDNTALYEPYGVVAAITPWNSPLMIAAWKIAPAMAAGNTIVLKPSEHASVSTLLFAEMVCAGLPTGVLNVITGRGPEVGAALVAHPLVGKVTFTGSDAGGRQVAAVAAGGVKPVTLELGGKSPQLVFADADLDSAVNGVLAGICLSNGQSCIAGSRLIVAESIGDAVLERLVARMKKLQAGDPMQPATTIAPLANAPQLEKVLSMIAAAKAEGARCVYGGRRLHPDGLRGGFYVEPAIFTQVTPDMRLWREEVFGPVLAVTTFADEQEALALANDTEYGLAAGIWSANRARCERLAGRIAAGTVYVNHYRSVDAGSPIGGYKRSGYGRELGPDAVSDFLQVKSVWVDSTPCPDPFPPAA